MGSSAMVFPGVCDPATLETLACREALALAADLNIRQITIASDCKQVVGDIADGTGGQYSSIIREISQQRLEFERTIFRFEGRKSNLDAHILARFALSLDQGRHLWLNEPHDISVIPVLLVIDQ